MPKQSKGGARQDLCSLLVTLHNCLQPPAEDKAEKNTHWSMVKGFGLAKMSLKGSRMPFARASLRSKSVFKPGQILS